ncbi:MAG: alanine:cation symporter family protein [Myxococcota bacterium]
MASLGGGNMNQANTVAVSARTDFGLDEVLVGIVTAILVGAVILGGIKRIGQVSSKLTQAWR